jgi:hypothetical protein
MSCFASVSYDMFQLIFNGSQIISVAPCNTGDNMTDETVSTNTTSCDLAEIVEEIINNLHPLTRRKTEVEAGIQQAIDLIKRQIPREAFLRDRNAIKNSAEEVGDAIADLERSLQRIHPIVKGALSPPREMMPPEPAEMMPPEPPDPLDLWVDELRWRRIRCEQLARDPGGHHPNFDPTKRDCAQRAFELMREFSEQEPASTIESPFRTITSLLYQAISGKRQDLKKACDTVKRAENEARERRRLAEIAWAKAGWIKVAGGWLPPRQPAHHAGVTPGGWPNDEDDAPPF